MVWTRKVEYYSSRFDGTINDWWTNKNKRGYLHHKENVDVIPSSLDLTVLEMSLVNVMSREYTMRNCLSEVKKDYDYIILDCMPSLGMMMINALASTDSVIIPVQS